jgi:hypothetical protein
MARSKAGDSQGSGGRGAERKRKAIPQIINYKNRNYEKIVSNYMDWLLFLF